MVKLFFVGVAVIIFAVIASFTAVFLPLLTGVTHNLGGNPSFPFHSPLPQPWVDWVDQQLGLATPVVWLTALYGLAALLLVYTLGNLVRYVIIRVKERRRLWADLRWRGRVSAAHRQAGSKSGDNAEADSQTVWE